MFGADTVNRNASMSQSNFSADCKFDIVSSKQFHKRGNLSSSHLLHRRLVNFNIMSYFLSASCKEPNTFVKEYTAKLSEEQKETPILFHD